VNFRRRNVLCRTPQSQLRGRSSHCHLNVSRVNRKVRLKTSLGRTFKDLTSTKIFSYHFKGTIVISKDMRFGSETRPDAP
jgi:hypothetical protein